MSESAETASSAAEKSAGPSAVKLSGLFAHKVGMASIYNEAGEVVPVTVLKVEPWVVSQIKTVEKDGYAAIQIASRPKRAAVANSAERGHLKAAGFENGAYFVKEIRQDIPAGLAVGQTVSIESVAKGDTVQITATSKGRGFAGVIKRYKFQGGPATHGSHFHRQPGSSGQRTWPGRIMPGKRFPGHLGDATTTVKNVTVVDVRPEDGILLLKGPVPGARHTLVKLMKE
jgi:large subunit ribosomal protein L3